MNKAIGYRNLIPLNKRTKEEQRRIAVMGGKKSGEIRQMRKTFREALEWYLSMAFTPDTDKDFELKRRFPTLTNRERLAISMVEAAMRDKDVRAAIYVRDTVGEMPQQKVAIEQEKPFQITIKTVE